MARLVVPALVLALAGFARADGGPAAQDPKPGFKLGVVNLKTCFDKEKYAKVKDIDAELQGRMEALTRRVKDLEKSIDDIKTKINAVDRNTQPRLWEDKKRQLALAETELKFQKELGRAQYLDYYADKKIEVYNEIRRVVQLVGEEHKFDLVLRVEQPLLDEQDPETVSQRINNRVVLYHASGVDITEMVVKRLNEEYAKAKLATGSAEWECKECGKKNRGDACTATPNCKGKKP